MPATSAYRGRVTGLAGDLATVEVPDLGEGVEYDAPYTVPTGIDPRTMRVGAHVIVTTLNGVADELVVIGVLD